MISFPSNLAIASLLAIVNFFQFCKYTKFSFSPTAHSSLFLKPSFFSSVSAEILLRLLLKYHLLGGACPGTSPWNAIHMCPSALRTGNSPIRALFNFGTLGKESSERVMPTSLCKLLACFLHSSSLPVTLSQWPSCSPFPLEHQFWCVGCMSINLCTFL